MHHVTAIAWLLKSSVVLLSSEPYAGCRGRMLVVNPVLHPNCRVRAQRGCCEDQPTSPIWWRGTILDIIGPHPSLEGRGQDGGGGDKDGAGSGGKSEDQR